MDRKDTGLVVQESFEEVTNHLVYKRNELIHAKFDLSAFAQKILAALVSRIDPRHESLPVFEFSVSEFSDIIGVSKQRVLQNIREVTIELQSQVVTVKVRNKHEEEAIKKEIELAKLEGREPDPIKSTIQSFKNRNWFENTEYDHEKQVILFQFKPYMADYLLNFNRNFTKYSLSNVLKMNSKYAIRFYEIFRSYLSISLVKQGITSIFRTIDYADLRSKLGISPKILIKFYDFERTVLKQAIKELDQSDLSFTYSLPERKVPKSRKKITKIQFNIIHINQSLIGNSWVDSLKNWVRKDRFDYFVSKFGEQRTKRNVELVVSQIEDGREINNIVAYITKAIKVDYANTDKALDPFNYTDDRQRDYIKRYVVPNWDKLDKQTQDDFIAYRFTKGLVADNFEKYISESGQRSISATIMDIHDTNW